MELAADRTIRVLINDFYGRAILIAVLTELDEVGLSTTDTEQGVKSF